MNDYAQEPSEFTIPGETYEMVQNKGLSKRNPGSINSTHHKRNREQFQISDETAGQSETNQLDQLFSNQVLLTRQSMSEEHSSRMKQQVRGAQETSFSMHEFKQSDTFRCLRDIQCNFDDLDFK